MFARRRPLLRAAVVGGGAYAMGRRSAQRDAEDSYQDARIAGQDQAGTGQGQPESISAEPSVSDQLTQLSRLHQEGSLSDEEFAAAKSRLLGS
jgi:hypothetical protein